MTKTEEKYDEKTKKMLKIAEKNGYLREVEYLLETGEDGDEDSVLFYALDKGATPELIEFLIEHGANLGCATSEGYYTPLMVADDPEIIRVLLEYGANVNDIDINCQTVIGHHENDEEILELLQEYGAYGPYQYSEDEMEKSKLLLENYKREDISKALIYAARLNLIDEVKELLEKDANVNAKDKGNRTALSWAAMRGNKEMVKILIDKGADINMSEGLKYAIMGDNLDIVELLIKKGADDYNGLFIAVVRNYADIAEMLLKNGVSADGEDGSTGSSFRSIASYRGNDDVLDLLDEYSSNEDDDDDYDDD